ncbi:hypothetical protein PR202_ga17231 [Eleusine coracana subsp. coracana]|uniref:Autophagy-related protein 2 n=1 Tax=Eleusine coracana subsp. coracana TaxID=191504 RepID=A0AAV5CPQ5_ELECO|nr:hypothetical protein PR202_ga17231 [Eleusine coracana subsp. coracana]
MMGLLSGLRLDTLLKRLCKSLLKKRLGDLILGDLDLDQFDLQLTRGTLQLNDLALNVEFINRKLSGSAIMLKEGSIKSLLVRFPLPVKSCEIVVEELELVLAPSVAREVVPRDAECSISGSTNDIHTSARTQRNESDSNQCSTSTSRDVDEGVKRIANAVKWFLTSFNIKLKNVYVVFDPQTTLDNTVLDSNRSLVFRIKEAEFGTLLSTDGLVKLNNFVTFDEAVIEFLKMDAVDALLQNDLDRGTTDILGGHSTTAVLTGPIGGFSGKLNLSIPWSNGRLNLEKIDADVSVDSLELRLQISSIRWIMNVWDSLQSKPVDEQNCAYSVADMSTNSFRSAFCSSASSSSKLDSDCFMATKEHLAHSTFSQSKEDKFQDSFLTRAHVITDWMLPVAHEDIGYPDSDCDDSIDQFFECFEELRNSQSSLGNSGIWDWTCSVFNAISCATTLASGSDQVPKEQPTEKTLRASIAEMHPKNLRFKASVAHMKLDEFYHTGNSVSYHPHLGSLFLNNNLRQDVQDALPQCLFETGGHQVENSELCGKNSSELAKVELLSTSDGEMENSENSKGQTIPANGTSIQTSIIFECSKLEICTELDETVEVGPLLQAELEGSWNSFKLRGDGEGTNVLSTGIAGCSVTHIKNPKLQENYTSVDVHSGTIVAPGGRMDWITAICLLFSSGSDGTQQSDDSKTASNSQEGETFSSSFFLELVDVAVSYEPHLKKFTLGAETVDRKFFSCLLAASSFKLHSNSAPDSSATDFDIQLRDLGLLICGPSSSKNVTCDYGVDYLRQAGYAKVVQNTFIEANLRIDSSFWKLEISDSQFDIGTCHDTTYGLVRLGSQLQQLYDKSDNSLENSADSGDCQSDGLLDDIIDNAFHTEDYTSNEFWESNCHHLFSSTETDDGSELNAPEVHDSQIPLQEYFCPDHIIDSYYMPELQRPSSSSTLYSEEYQCISGGAARDDGGWYNNSTLTIAENHVLKENNEQGEKAPQRDTKPTFSSKNPDESCNLKGKVLIHEIDVKWRMYAGDDWLIPLKDCCPGTKGRDRSHSLEFTITGLGIQLDLYPDGDVSVSKLSISAQDLNLCDQSANAPWKSLMLFNYILVSFKKVLGCYTSKDYPRESCSCAFRLELESVRPEPQAPLEDYR